MQITLGNCSPFSKMGREDTLQAYQEQNTTVEPGFRWIKNPAAITPVWLEKPERIATLVMLTVLGLLVYALIQRHGWRYLRHHGPQFARNNGGTTLPPAALVGSPIRPVTSSE